jgi:5-methylcytosine-specific restriction endonuclease McrA
VPRDKSRRVRPALSVRLADEHVFAMGKDWERERAQYLRAKGWPLRLIASELGVSLSSAWKWTTDVALPVPPDPPPNPSPAIESLGTKHCRSCGRELPLTEFNRTEAALGRGRCRACAREYFRRRGELHVRQSNDARRRRREAARRYVFALLTRSRCKDCGLEDPLVLEFDHIGPKSANVADLVLQGYGTGRIAAEIERCEIVCVNCHRRRTARRGLGWRLDPANSPALQFQPLIRRNLLFLISILTDSSCVDCSETDIVVLEFDHIGPKRNSVATLALGACSLDTIKREIAQCEIRCANCHRRRTIRSLRHFRHHLATPL